MHIRDALDRFLLQLRADGRSPHTVRQYARHVRAFARWWAEVGHGAGIEAVGPDAVARFMTATQANRRPDGAAKKPASVNALRTSLRCFFAFVHEVGIAAANPARRLRRARCAPPPPRGMADDDLDRLITTLEKAQGDGARRDLALVRLLAASGMRLGSAIALDVEDLDLDAGEAHPRRAKGDAPEPVVLPTALCDHLRDYLGERTSGPVFCGRGGRRITIRHAQRRLNHWLERAGTKQRWGAHALRHRYAVRLYRRTGDLRIVQQALGHRSIASTTVYARADRSRLIAALEG